MRAWIISAWIGGMVLLVGGGCVASREREVMVEPTYSYVRDQPELTTTEIWPVMPDPLADHSREPALSEFRWPMQP
ncbi:MAG: hypothetical protein WD534_04945 [Phycisphaeraceae bacterium]